MKISCGGGDGVFLYEKARGVAPRGSESESGTS